VRLRGVYFELDAIVVSLGLEVLIYGLMLHAVVLCVPGGLLLRFAGFTNGRAR
jgi:hypothetical protein